jgi:hypothetical protein
MAEDANDQDQQGNQTRFLQAKTKNAPAQIAIQEIDRPVQFFPI